ncbi:MAG: hypothetical protein ACFFEY_20770, partial [Candidatus Thorarchaeota archaeon]
MERKHQLILLAVIFCSIVLFSIAATFLLNYSSFNTRQLGQIHTGGNAVDVEIQGDIVYVIDNADFNSGGLVIINVSDPSSPSILGSYYQSGVPFKVSVVGEIAFLANSQVGLEILNVSNPSNPIKIDQYTGSGAAYDIEIVGEFGYLADWGRG